MRSATYSWSVGGGCRLKGHRFELSWLRQLDCLGSWELLASRSTTTQHLATPLLKDVSSSHMVPRSRCRPRPRSSDRSKRGVIGLPGRTRSRTPSLTPGPVYRHPLGDGGGCATRDGLRHGVHGRLGASPDRRTLEEVLVAPRISMLMGQPVGGPRNRCCFRSQPQHFVEAP